MDLLFPIASIGVINGFIIGLYLLFRKQRSVANYYFAGLILAFCIRIGKSVLVHYSSASDPLVRQIGLSACIFIGPFFYFYLKSLRKGEERASRFESYLLWLIAITIVGIGLIFPYRQYPAYWNPEIVYFIYAVWIVFIILGVIEGHKILGSYLFAPWKLTGDRRYLSLTIISVILITLTYQLALYLVNFTYIWGSFIFSFSFYVLGFRALRKQNIVAKSVHKKLQDGSEIMSRLNVLMKEEKLFKNKNLRLDDLARELSISRHVLSQVLNETDALGYANYIKRLRIEEAKSLIISHPHMSLEGIGYEAGFGSKSGFFDAFKKMENVTPAEYTKKKDVQMSPN
ncbi:MAG: AraC family transcriptional regulator [Ekhidna sp.]|nr:AraC family transcriptional regulator [Ekhidna sp.]